MIFPEINNLDSAVSVYLTKMLPHYRIAISPVVVREYSYTLKNGESLYTVGQKIFGNDFQWTILADMNSWKMPDQFGVGDIIRVPEILAR